MRKGGLLAEVVGGRVAQHAQHPVELRERRLQHQQTAGHVAAPGTKVRRQLQLAIHCLGGRGGKAGERGGPRVRCKAAVSRMPLV